MSSVRNRMLQAAALIYAEAHHAAKGGRSVDLGEAEGALFDAAEAAVHERALPGFEIEAVERPASAPRESLPAKEKKPGAKRGRKPGSGRKAAAVKAPAEEQRSIALDAPELDDVEVPPVELNGSSHDVDARQMGVG